MRSGLVPVALLAVIVIAAPSAMADNGVGGQAGAFLRIPAGARPAGMGGAFVSLADDIDALAFNPGGLCGITSSAAGVSYSLLSMERTHYEAGVVLPQLAAGSVGLLINGFGVSGIDGRDAEGNRTGTFGDSEMAFTLGYAHELGNSIGLGMNIKYLTQSLSDNKATGFGFDLGALARFQLPGSVLSALRVGVSASNLGAALAWDTASDREDEIPMTLRYGTSADLAIGPTNLILALEGSTTADASTKIHIGSELWINSALALRAGMNGDDMNFGAGIIVRQLQFDYAYCQDVLDEGTTHRMGVTFHM